MAWLMVSTFGYALALPFLQDDRSRQRNREHKTDRLLRLRDHRHRMGIRTETRGAMATVPIRKGMRSRASMPSRF